MAGRLQGNYLELELFVLSRDHTREGGKSLEKGMAIFALLGEVKSDNNTHLLAMYENLFYKIHSQQR